MLDYSSQNIFSSPPGSTLVFALDTRGEGDGVDLLRLRFPLTYRAYRKFCIRHAPGEAFIAPEENGYVIACLITKTDYDTDDDILDNTRFALDNLVRSKSYLTYYSIKLNYGVFSVRWYDTEKIIEDFVNKFNVNWVICNG